MWEDDLGGKKACVFLLLFWAGGGVLVPLTEEVRTGGVVEREKDGFHFEYVEPGLNITTSCVELDSGESFGVEMKHTDTHMHIHYTLLKDLTTGKEGVKIAVKSNI